MILWITSCRSSSGAALFALNTQAPRFVRI
jgi:hypothetical protein